ncbi:hypothetical protein ACFXTI_026479 [Malus domestica]
MAEEAILGYLESKNEISDSGQFTAERGLHGFRYIVAQDIKRVMWMFTDEGMAYTATGLPEVQLFLAIPPEGCEEKMGGDTKQLVTRKFILAKKCHLGTIWIAAHLERKLRKNQVADTDIGVSV